MAYKVNHAKSKEIGSEEFGMLPMLHYTFDDVNQGTDIFFDEGSNTSLITSKLVHSLYLTGKKRLTTVSKACDREGKTQARTHHQVELVDRFGKKHKIHCIEVPFITEPQPQPDYKEVHRLFPHLPKGCLNRPDMEVGLLLGQNANILLPNGGGKKNQVGNL